MPKPAPLPERWTRQAFRFALDPTDTQLVMFARHAGMRRFAYNWAIAEMKAGIESHHRGEETEPPSAFGLQHKWNQAKRDLCRNDETGEEWWQEVSKCAPQNAIDAATRAYWDWIKSRSGKRKGRRLGFPRFQKKGRSPDRFKYHGGSEGLRGRRHVWLPKIGQVRLAENARQLDRLISKGLARVTSVTVSREVHRWHVVFQVAMLRPQVNHKPSDPGSVVGIDLGVRRLATVASADGSIIDRIDNPKALDDALVTLRRLNKTLARSQPGSKRRAKVVTDLQKAHSRIAHIRRDAIHKATRNLTKSHGRIILEDLNVAGMARQIGPGSRTRKRGIHDAAMGEFSRQIEYKAGWYGSELVRADRWYPSSQICSDCGHRNRIGRLQQWTCGNCGSEHDRDDNAARNLARYESDNADRFGRDRRTVGAASHHTMASDRVQVSPTTKPAHHAPASTAPRPRQSTMKRKDTTAVSTPQGAQMISAGPEDND